MYPQCKIDKNKHKIHINMTNITILINNKEKNKEKNISETA